MTYTTKISVEKPAAIVIMVDQSGSMSEHINWNNQEIPKANAVAEIINNLLDEFVVRSRSENSYRHYYDIMVIGYSGGGVKSLLNTGNSYFMSPSELVGSINRIETIQRERHLPNGQPIINSTKQRVWVEPKADGRTPMKAAFATVNHQLRRWCRKNPTSFPPLIFNITDGEVTDSTLEGLTEIIENIKKLSTKDGVPLLTNIHLSRTTDNSTLFPTSKSELVADRYAEFLFDISSEMPRLFSSEIALLKGDSQPKVYHGMAYNASVSDMVRILNIGSTTINQILT